MTCFVFSTCAINIAFFIFFIFFTPPYFSLLSSFPSNSIFFIFASSIICWLLSTVFTNIVFFFFSFFNFVFVIFVISMTSLARSASCLNIACFIFLYFCSSPSTCSSYVPASPCPFIFIFLYLRCFHYSLCFLYSLDQFLLYFSLRPSFLYSPLAQSSFLFAIYIASLCSLYFLH